MTNHWSFIIKKTLYYNDLDTEDSILHPVNSDDTDGVKQHQCLHNHYVDNVTGYYGCLRLRDVWSGWSQLDQATTTYEIAILGMITLAFL